jgi:hypothetical protein
MRKLPFALAPSLLWLPTADEPCEPFEPLPVAGGKLPLVPTESLDPMPRPVVPVPAPPAPSAVPPAPALTWARASVGRTMMAIVPKSLAFMPILPAFEHRSPELAAEGNVLISELILPILDVVAAQRATSPDNGDTCLFYGRHARSRVPSVAGGSQN